MQGILLPIFNNQSLTENPSFKERKKIKEKKIYLRVFKTDKKDKHEEEKLLCTSRFTRTHNYYPSLEMLLNAHESENDYD
ncbi:hypothetical protein CEXT_386461 [Caerostris extrusa]|uniref:Uncharacterized protein n=1 Tax=Caerostris extrusa TaxID=172846 RepID=A0AAV4W828_CAEEX|nr:hypothetical protein CEXT_386461 [Caerostris extrusa]